MFSDKIIPRSTKVPIAIAMPDKATIFASTLNIRISINTINIEIGNTAAIIKEALRLNNMISTMIMVINTSRFRASHKVSRVSLMSCVRS